MMGTSPPLHEIKPQPPSLRRSTPLKFANLNQITGISVEMLGRMPCNYDKIRLLHQIPACLNYDKGFVLVSLLYLTFPVTIM